MTIRKNNYIRSCMVNKKNVVSIIIMAAVVTIIMALYHFMGSSSSSFPFAPSRFDAYVNKAMDDWHVPGLALAIIKDDQVAYMQCYGVLKEGEEARVNEQTIFAIGSCSKPFTGTAMGMLVDDGKVTWDAPARTYL